MATSAAIGAETISNGPAIVSSATERSVEIKVNLGLAFSLVVRASDPETSHENRYEYLTSAMTAVRKAMTDYDAIEQFTEGERTLEYISLRRHARDEGDKLSNVVGQLMLTQSASDTVGAGFIAVREMLDARIKSLHFVAVAIGAISAPFQG